MRRQHQQHIVELSDGRRISFSTKRRKDEPFYFVVFRGRSGKRIERSTKECSQKRAFEVASRIIRDEFDHRTVESPSWTEARESLAIAMKANNNRQTSIDDYLNTLELIEKFFPASRGPGDISPNLAKRFKSEYLTQPYSRSKPKPPRIWKGRGRKPKPVPPPVEYHRKPRTIHSRLRKLRVIWGRWLIRELRIVNENPWSDVKPPRLEKLTPRYLTPDEVKGFFEWLDRRWSGWPLPRLFLTVKSFIGNRISELCSLNSSQLQNGRIVFPADVAKGRKERKAILAPDLFEKLKALAGETFVWERFPTELREQLIAKKKVPTNLLPDFSPARLKHWIQDEIDDYCKSHPEVKRFSAHSFRKRAMTEAWRLGIQPEKAAIAFGCNVKTMMEHYVAMDEVAISDEVLTAIAHVTQPPDSSTNSG